MPPAVARGRPAHPHVDRPQLDLSTLWGAPVPLGELDVDEVELVGELAGDRGVASPHRQQRKHAALVVLHFNLALGHDVVSRERARRCTALRSHGDRLQLAVDRRDDRRASEDAPFAQDVGDLALTVDDDGHGRDSRDGVERRHVHLGSGEPCAETPAKVLRRGRVATGEIVAAADVLPVVGQERDQDAGSAWSLNHPDLSAGTACEVIGTDEGCRPEVGRELDRCVAVQVVVVGQLVNRDGALAVVAREKHIGRPARRRRGLHGKLVGDAELC